MPFLVDRSSSARYQPQFRIEPEDPPFLNEYAQAHNRMRPTDQDVEVPDSAFPIAAYEKTNFKVFPDFLSLMAWPGVSEEARTIIEEFEPGVHQFSPEFAVFHKDGRRSEKKYYCLNVRHYLDHTIIIEKSPQLVRHGNAGRHKISAQVIDCDLMLDEAIIGSRHFWRAKDCFRWWFMSDELARRIQKAKLKKLDFTAQLVGHR